MDIRGLFKFKMNAEDAVCDQYLDFHDSDRDRRRILQGYGGRYFGSGLLVVGCMLLLTAALLAFSYYAKPRQKESRFR